MTSVRLVCLAGVFALLSIMGCYPATELARPRVMRPGHMQVAVASMLQSKAPKHRDIPIPLQALQVGASVGLTDRVEAIGRLTFTSVEGGLRVGLLQAEHAGEFDLTLGAMAITGKDADAIFEESWDPTTNGHFTGVRVPLMLGYRLEKKREPWIAIVGHAGEVRHDDGDSTRTGPHATYVAASIAVGFDVRLSDWVTLQPQVAYLHHFAGLDVPDARLGSEDRRFAASLAFYFGPE